MDVDSFMASGFTDLLNEGSDESDGELGDGDGTVEESSSEPEAASDDDDDDGEGEGEGASADETESDGDSSEGEEAEARLEAAEGEAAAHAAQLASLKESQPEFYKYLMENDKVRLRLSPSPLSR